MADKQISDLTSASAMTDGSLFVIEQGGAAKRANWGMIKNYISPGVAAQYSSSATYNVGDYVIYNGQLYRCTTAITTPESWTAAHWTAAVLGDDVGELKSALTGREDVGTSSDWQNIVLTFSGYEVVANTSNTRICTNKRKVISNNQFLVIQVADGYKYRVVFFKSIGNGNITNGVGYGTAEGNYDDLTTWHTEKTRMLQCPSDAVAYTVNLAKVNDSSVSPSDCSNISMVVSWGSNLIDAYGLESILPNIKAVNEVKLPNYIADKLAYKYGYVTGAGAVTPDYGDLALYYEAPVTPSKSYTLLFDANYYGICFAWYTADGTFISRDNSFPAQINKKTSTAPSSASFVRVAVYVQSGNLTIDYVIAHRFVLTDSEYENFDIAWFADNYHAKDSAFYGKRLSVLGDSMSTFAGTNPSSDPDGHLIADGTYTYEGNHCRYPQNYMRFASELYWVRVLKSLGMQMGVNDSWAGSCVSWDGTSGSDKGANIYIASPTRIGHLDDNGTPDYILVNAGTNDIGLSVALGTFNTESPVDYTDAQIASLPVATFADAYRAMLIRLQKAYPLARIVVMLPNYTTSYYNPTNADKYLEVIKEACDYFGVPYIDMRTTGITMYNTGTYTGDGIHPNVNGMELLYEKVLKFFEYSL